MAAHGGGRPAPPGTTILRVMGAAPSAAVGMQVSEPAFVGDPSVWVRADARELADNAGHEAEPDHQARPGVLGPRDRECQDKPL